ncbi:hypothetical protein B0A55_01724 [Friedmanniomyces simplex]|uniref:DUF952 domain-containing protein n=1 Tax=Friedmanniomyces simplex TaxID=329884 RepID=A0A4U0XW12_9PEZI|nr:hypothetical protein B0A55_01724 [Friedmanniomyces simplex]
MAVPTSTVRFLYKILSSRPPMPIPRAFTPIDASDGFVHLSTAAQTPATASRFFGTESNIWIVKIDREKLEAGEGELKWEESKSHGVFAHLMEGKDWEELLQGLEE